MGITSFSVFIKKYAPNCYYEVCLDLMKGLKIAFDMNNVMFKFASVATKRIVNETNLRIEEPDRNKIDQLVLDFTLNHLETYISYGIVPICVFDGKSHPLKNHAREKRKKIREKKEIKLEEARKKLYGIDTLKDPTSKAISEYAKYYCQLPNVPPELINTMKQILEALGLPVICSEDINMISNDAEAVCASLCIEGNEYCYATVTTDSDFHVYGGCYSFVDMYRKTVERNGERVSLHFVKMRSLASILYCSGLTFEKFRDLCILMGTDFNPNIKNVGTVRSWNRIRDHGSIVNLSKVENVSVLNYTNVLVMFECTIIRLSNIWTDIDFNALSKYGREILTQYQLQNHVSNINNYAHLFNKVEKKIEKIIKENKLFNNGTIVNLESMSF